MFKLAELFVAITGNASSLNRTLDGVHARLLGFGGAGARAGQSLAAGIVGGMGLGGIGGAGLGVAGLGLALGASAKMASNFESQMNLLQRVAGLTNDELGRMDGNLRRMALSSDLAGVSLRQLGEAAVMGGRMGIAGDELEGFVKTAGELALALDDIPVEASVQGIAQILGVYGKGVDEARNFAGALDALSNNARTTGGEILDVAARLKGSASVLGLSPQDLLALSTAMKDVGISTEIAGTNMGVILAKMAQDTEEFARVAGVSVSEFERMLDEGPLRALEAFIGGLEGGRADFGLLAELGITGERARGVVLQLSQSMERLRDFQALSNEEWETMAFLNNDLAKVTASSEAQITQSWNRITDVLIDFGEATLPSVVAALEGVAEVAEDIRHAISGAFDADAAERFAAELREVIDTARAAPAAVLGQAEDLREADRGLGRTVMSSLMELGKYVNPFTTDMADRAQARLMEEMVDDAFGAIDRGRAAMALPPRPPGPRGEPEWWDPDYRAPIGAPEGFTSRRAAGEGGVAATAIGAAIAGALQAMAVQEQAKALAAEELAVRRAAEDREARGVGRSTDLAGFARELQHKALAGADVAEKQLKAQEDALILERLQEEHLRRLVDRPADGAARAS